MSQLWRFLKKICVRVIGFIVIAQALTWAMGIDDVVRQWLAEHQIYTFVAVILYGLWDYLIYGGKEAEYYEELKRRTPRKPK